MDCRTTIDEVMMECALAFAQRSTCERIQAGAVIALDNHIVSTGYNGNAPGQQHCTDYFFNLWAEGRHAGYYKEYNSAAQFFKSEDFKNLHREWATEHELHAEMNAIIYASRKGIPIVGANIYTTYSPCIFCTKAIIHSGIKKVVYHTLYDRPEGQRSIKILKENEIKVIDINEEYL